MLTERSKALLSSLLTNDDPVPVASLSQLFKVSNRTVRYDLDKIDDWLKSNMLPQLVRKPNRGVEFVRDSQSRQNALARLGGRDFRYYVLSAQERTKVIIAELLQKKDYVTIDQLAEKVAVSRSTMINDLAGVKGWLTGYGLQLVPLRRYGMRVVGEEKDLRRCVVDFLNEHLTLTEALELIKPPAIAGGQDRSGESNLLAQLDVTVIEESVRRIESELGIVFSDVAFTNLVLHMALAIRRLQLGRIIDMPKTELDGLRHHSQFAVVTAVAKDMSERLGVAMPEDEIGYITQHVLASGVSSAEKDEVPIDLQMVVCNLISGVGYRLRVDFASDQQLFQGLAAHIAPAIERLVRGLPIRNPYLKELQTYQRELYEVVGQCAATVLAGRDAPLSPDEIGFLAMHFGAALERRLLGRVLPAVLVVCGTGAGTASLLSSRLRSNFNLNIVDNVAVHQVKDVLKATKVDLIISTIPLADTGVKTVCVTPFLTPRDMNELRSVLRDKCSPDFSVDSVLEIVDRHCTILDQKALVWELTAYFGDPGAGGKARDGEPALRLGDVLTEEFVSLDVLAENWEAAVITAGDLLVRSGAVEPLYVANMVAAIKQLGPYVVIAPGVALPHASNAAGVRRLAVSCVRLARPVVFGKPENDPVDLLFSFATPDKVSHRRILQELGRLLGDDAAMKRLRQAGNVDGFLAVIRDFWRQETRKGSKEEDV
ncbi:MAG: BglG family transcription antiterminator [Negativicutes bacterium]|nr:BglG family transcription antiterminator [Negativicutes bacterium]